MGEIADTRADLRRGPLHDWALEDAGGSAVTLSATGFRALVILRGRPDDESFVAAAREVLGVDLPLAPNRWTGDEARAVLWLGPDEWLILAPDGEAPDIDDRLRAAMGSDPWLSVVDVSQNYTGLTLTGPAARDVLAKGCSLDLHVRNFRTGDCAQSLLAGTLILLRATENADCIECWVRNSFARYTAQWLMDAMAEFRD